MTAEELYRRLIGYAREKRIARRDIAAHIGYTEGGLANMPWQKTVSDQTRDRAMRLLAGEPIRRVDHTTPEQDKMALPRVSRDPCPRCGAKGGECAHEVNGRLLTGMGARL